MLTEQQIEAMVKQKYPVTEKERTCAFERVRREELRNFYRERLRTNQEHYTLN